MLIDKENLKKFTLQNRTFHMEQLNIKPSECAKVFNDQKSECSKCYHSL